MNKRTVFQEQVIDKAIDTYIESKKLLKQSQELDDGISTDYLQSKLGSIMTRLNKHFAISSTEILTLIKKSNE
jgi:hypothetical protein